MCLGWGLLLYSVFQPFIGWRGRNKNTFFSIVVFVYFKFININCFNFMRVFAGTNFSDRDLINLRRTIARSTQLTITKRNFIIRKWNLARLHRRPRCRTGIWPVRRMKVKDARPIRWSLFVRYVLLLLFRVCAVWSAKNH